MVDQREPLTHIARPTLPWREEEHLTECKLDARSYPTWSREEAWSQARVLGKTRFAMVVCITCWQTAERWPTWDQDPVGALGREIRWYRDNAEMRYELRAIELLIAAHRDDFDAILADLGTTVDLAEQRQARRTRRR